MKHLIPRRFERKRLVGHATVRPLGGVPLPAMVHDLGQSGMSVFVIRGLTKGQTVEVSFKVQGSDACQAIAKRDGQIVRSRALADGNILGIAFARPFEAHELSLLETHWVRT